MGTVYDILSGKEHQPISKPTRKKSRARRRKRRPINPDNYTFSQLLLMAGIPRSEAADFLGVSKRTVQRWLAGPDSPSTPVVRLLEAVAGHQPAGDDSWTGYRIVGAELTLPNGTTLVRKDIDAIPHLRTAVDRLSLHNKQLRIRLKKALPTDGATFRRTQGKVLLLMDLLANIALDQNPEEDAGLTSIAYELTKLIEGTGDLFNLLYRYEKGEFM